MAGFYSHVSDKKLMAEISKTQSKLKGPKTNKYSFYIKKLKILEKEKNNRYRKSVMSIKNLIKEM